MKLEHVRWGLRVIACAFLCLLPLYFPHSPWKPEETRVIGVLLNYLDSHSVLNYSMFRVSLPPLNALFWWMNIEWIQLIPSARFEIIARVVSVFSLVIGTGALYGWSRAMHIRYPHLIPASIVSGAPLLVASSLGILIRGYQATPESVWFAGIALMLWAAAEKHGLKRNALLGVSGFWLMGCGGIAGLFLVFVCAGFIPWYRYWISKPTNLYYRVHGLYIVGLILALGLLGIFQGANSFGLDLVLSYFKEVLKVLVWYGLPIWPLALAVWLRGGVFQGALRAEWNAWRWEPILQMVVTVLIALHTGNISWRESHILMYLPFIVTMALPGLYVVDVRGWFNAVHWFTRSVLILVLIVVWLTVFALYYRVPFWIYKQLEGYQPDFSPMAMSPFIWLISIVLTLYAVRYLIVPCRTLPDSLWRWTLGFGCTGCVIRLLLVPYIDYGRSYEKTMLLINQAVPKSALCVQIMPSVGAPQRAMWSYYTKRSIDSGDCDWRIVQSNDDILSVDQYWLNQEKSIWKIEREAHRPGDQTEKFYLLHKINS